MTNYQQLLAKINSLPNTWPSRTHDGMSGRRVPDTNAYISRNIYKEFIICNQAGMGKSTSIDFPIHMLLGSSKFT